MNLERFDSKLLKLAVACAALIVALVPFHAILTVWTASWLGHYTAVRLWSLGLLILAGLVVVWVMVRDRGVRSVLRQPIAWLIGGYIAIQLIWGVVALLTHHVDKKALGYGWIVDVRFLIFFVVMWALALKTDWLRAHWQSLVFWPLAVVVVFGLLQYFVLPYDVMKHFGYNANNIFPYETINHNVHRLRVMSTLRGANPLGAYLVVTGSLLLAVLLKQAKKDWRLMALGVGTLVVLILTFSRGAWLGMVVSVVVLLWFQLKSSRTRRIALAMAAVLAVSALISFVALRNNTTFQDFIFHTNAKSTITTTSDQGHASAFRAGLHDLVHEPLGHGPGTAGPASVYSNHPARIAENYFIQIGQEVGWLGLTVFIVINVWVAKLLWLQRADTLALGLFAGLLGVSVVALLSHAWTDDTLAFLWWGLAGLAVGNHAVLRSRSFRTPNHRG